MELSTTAAQALRQLIFAREWAALPPGEIAARARG